MDWGYGLRFWRRILSVSSRSRPGIGNFPQLACKEYCALPLAISIIVSAESSTALTIKPAPNRSPFIVGANNPFRRSLKYCSELSARTGVDHPVNADSDDRVGHYKPNLPIAIDIDVDLLADEFTNFDM